jgi:soluble lytic murein transglycosylase
MIRFLFKLLLCALLAAVASAVFFALRSSDPVYTIYEWLSPARFQQYDQLIQSVAAKNQVDPMLIKAVVWRESRFDAHKYGSAGERGLMLSGARLSR